MKNFVFLSFVCIALASCAPAITYQKKGATDREVAKDFNECLVQANQIQGDLNGALGISLFAQARNRCMYGKGYDVLCDGKVCK